MFNSKGRILAGWIQIELFDVIDFSKSRAGGEIVLECFDLLCRAFDEAFDATVVQVLDIAEHLMSRGRALGEEAIPDALNISTDKKTPGDFA